MSHPETPIYGSMVAPATVAPTTPPGSDDLASRVAQLEEELAAAKRNNAPAGIRASFTGGDTGELAETWSLHDQETAKAKGD